MFCNFIIKDDPLLFEAVQLGWPCMETGVYMPIFILHKV